MVYDAITAGGGLGGSALADRLARAGRKALVLEWETRFKDRVRGENMLCWSVAAAKRLGIYGTFIAAGGKPAKDWESCVMGNQAPTRDLTVTTPGGDPMLNVFHPDVQEAVLAGDEEARGRTLME